MLAEFVPAVLLVVASLVETLVGMPLLVVVPVRGPSSFLRARQASLLSAGSATAVSAVTSKAVLVFDKVIALLVVACLVRGACLISPAQANRRVLGLVPFFLLDRGVVVLGVVGPLLALALLRLSRWWHPRVGVVDVSPVRVPVVGRLAAGSDVVRSPS